MRILFAVWELAPFFQVGGLGDVAKSLPIALSSLGIDIRVIIPLYKAFKLQNQKAKLIKTLQVNYDNKYHSVNVYEVKFINYNIPIYLLRNDEYLSIPSRETFAFYNLAVVEFLKKYCDQWNPEIIHCNDHHTGFIPLLIKHNDLKYKTLFTIHNLQHKGQHDIETIKRIGIEPGKCRLFDWEIKRLKVSFLLEGLIHADLINTVSPTYAKEIMKEEYGCGLDEILRDIKSKINGILNGIDYEKRDPSTDKNIIYHYSARKNDENNPKIYRYLDGKTLNKKFLQEKFGFQINKEIPVVSFIGRFDSSQKGLDIIHKMLRRIDLEKFQFVFLGKGDIDWEERFNWLSSFYPKNVYCSFEFDDRLASQIYAGSDFIMIPSKFEPCGLIQMIAMRYGTIPIARETGGLKDSILNGIDGYLFSRYTSYDLEKVLLKAVDIWKNNKPNHNQIIFNAMVKDFSWKIRGKQYVDLYRKLLA